MRMKKTHFDKKVKVVRLRHDGHLMKIYFCAWARFRRRVELHSKIISDMKRRREEHWRRAFLRSLRGNQLLR